MTTGARAASALHDRRERPVGLEPLWHCLLRLVPVLAAWALVLLGRGICLVAQRVPPVALTVRACRRRLAERRQARLR